MKGFLIGLGVLLVIALMFGMWYIRGLNYVVTLDENVTQSWAQIDNQLQRRNDLIPNLVNTVKGYAAHEKTTLENVTKMRSQWANATTRGEKIQAANGMGAALSKLLLVAENYPNLKASQNFITLQTQLEGTENRIAVERMRYNKAVQLFNTYIRSVFGSFFATRRGLNKPAEYFKAEETAKEVPNVSFE